MLFADYRVGSIREAEVKLPVFSWLDFTASRNLIQGFQLRRFRSSRNAALLAMVGEVSPCCRES
jgi:hypothetical protein